MDGVTNCYDHQLHNDDEHLNNKESNVQGEELSPYYKIKFSFAPFYLLISVSILLFIISVSCDKNPSGPDENDDTSTRTKVTSVVIEAPRTLLAVGESVQLKAIAKDVGLRIIEGKTFEWKGSDEQVATVSPNGLVSALKNGNLTVTATTESVSGTIGLEIPLSISVNLDEDVPSSAKQHIRYYLSALDSTKISVNSQLLVSSNESPTQLIFAFGEGDTPLIVGMKGSDATQIGIESTALVMTRFALGFLESKQIEAEQFKEITTKAANYNELVTRISAAVSNGSSPVEDREVIKSAITVADQIYGQVSSQTKNISKSNSRIKINTSSLLNTQSAVREIDHPLPFYFINSTSGEQFRVEDISNSSEVDLFNETRIDWEAITFSEAGKEISKAYLPGIAANLNDLTIGDFPDPVSIAGNNNRFLIRIKQDNATKATSGERLINYFLLFVLEEAAGIDPETQQKCTEETATKIFNAKFPDLAAQKNGAAARSYIVEKLPAIFSGNDATQYLKEIMNKCGGISPDTDQFLLLLKMFSAASAKFIASLTFIENANINLPQAHFFNQVIKYWAHKDSVLVCKVAGEVKPCPVIIEAVDKIEITAPQTLMSVDESVQLNATLWDYQGNDISMNYTVVWYSSDYNIADVNQRGLVTGLAEGKAYILANSGGKLDSVLIEVKSHNIRISPEAAEISVKDDVQFNARIFDFKNNDVTSRYPVQWSSSDEFVASVDQQGLVTGVAEGEAYIIGLGANKKDSVEVRVRSVIVVITPDSAEIFIEGTTQFNARVYDFQNNDVTNRFPVEWFTSNGSIASVNQQGLVMGLDKGEVYIIAEIDDDQDTAIVKVDLKPLKVTPENPEVLSLGGGDPSGWPTIQFNASGGTPPYYWTINNGMAGSINYNSGLYTSQRHMVKAKIEVTDSKGAKGSTVVTVMTSDLWVSVQCYDGVTNEGNYIVDQPSVTISGGSISSFLNQGARVSLPMGDHNMTLTSTCPVYAIISVSVPHYFGARSLSIDGIDVVSRYINGLNGTGPQTFPFTLTRYEINSAD